MDRADPAGPTAAGSDRDGEGRDLLGEPHGVGGLDRGGRMGMTPNSRGYTLRDLGTSVCDERGCYQPASDALVDPQGKRVGNYCPRHSNEQFTKHQDQLRAARELEQR